MRFKLRWSVLIGLLLLLAACSAPPQGELGDLEPQGVTGTTRELSLVGTTSFSGAGLAKDTGLFQYPEFPKGLGIDEGEGAADQGDADEPFDANHPVVNRSLPGTKPGKAVSARAGKKAKSNPDLITSFEGLNLYQQRYANGGNQFTIEPPDQALCVGNGYVLESVNSVLRVFDTKGNPLTGVIDLNTFYNYSPAIVRSTRTYGPFITDPVCYFDADTQRFYHVVLTIDTDPATGGFPGSNHLDIAVSQTSDPTGDWNIYSLVVTDDGNNCPCLGDYPHIGADANGIYITTNNFPFFVNGFNGAFIYALSKAELAAGASNVTTSVFDTSEVTDPLGNPGFTVWPAKSAGRVYDQALGGTEYFLSSIAVFEEDETAEDIVTWALSNTKSLDSKTPDLKLTNALVSVHPYAVPPLADQKAGPYPLGQCLNDVPCSNYFFGQPDPFTETLSKLDGSDSRMQQVYYANGKLWGALNTAVSMNGETKVGVAWYVLKPKIKKSGVSASVVLDGILALEDNNLTYPAVAVTQSGRGVMAFTVVGEDHYPSAGYAGIDAQVGAGEVHIAAEGAAPQDGFSGYKFFGNPPRPRWGDYGAADADGNTVWLASEYIAHSCTLDEYFNTLGSCGGTRTALGNWSTRISSVKP